MRKKGVCGLSFVLAGAAWLCAETFTLETAFGDLVFGSVVEAGIDVRTDSSGLSENFYREELSVCFGGNADCRVCELSLFSAKSEAFLFAGADAEFATAQDAAMLFLLYEFYTLAWGISVTVDPYGDFALPGSWQIRKTHVLFL